jgi:hypothetical protein
MKGVLLGVQLAIAEAKFYKFVGTAYDFIFDSRKLMMGNPMVNVYLLDEWCYKKVIVPAYIKEKERFIERLVHPLADYVHKVLYSKCKCIKIDSSGLYNTIVTLANTVGDLRKVFGDNTVQLLKELFIELKVDFIFNVVFSEPLVRESIDLDSLQDSLKYKVEGELELVHNYTFNSLVLYDGKLVFIDLPTIRDMTEVAQFEGVEVLEEEFELPVEVPIVSLDLEYLKKIDTMEEFCRYMFYTILPHLS